MTTQSTNKPVATLTDGALRAAIWRNQGENGATYAVSFSRLYKKAEGELANANSFSGAELLRLSMLAEQAYRETQALRQAHAAASASDAVQSAVGAAQ